MILRPFWKAKRQKCYQTHFMKPVLPWYENQIKTQQNNYRPISLMNAHANFSIKYWQAKFSTYKKNNSLWWNWIYTVHKVCKSVSVIYHHINKSRKETIWSYQSMQDLTNLNIPYIQTRNRWNISQHNRMYTSNL